MEYQAHPFADLFPMLDDVALQSLADDIAAHGLIEPIVLYAGQILDGRNRYRACLIAGVEPSFLHFAADSESEALDLVISKNLERRQLSESQRAMVAAKIANIRHGGQGGRVPEGEAAITVRGAAQALNVGTFLAKQAKRVSKNAEPHIIDMVQRGQIKVAGAELISTLPAAAQRRIQTPEQAREAIERLRATQRKLANKPAGALMRQILDAAEELAARDDAAAIFSGMRPHTLAGLGARIERTIDLLRSVGEADKRRRAASE